MPPKTKVSKEEILSTAVNLVRNDGENALNARNIARSLGCSTQPIFSNFINMDELRAAVKEKANILYQNCLAADMSAGKYPPYKASGMAYIRFAKEEKELFKLLFMRDRSGEQIKENPEEMEALIGLIAKQVNIDKEAARFFYLEMWAYTHGIASMIATGFYEWDEPLASRALTDVYEGLKHRYKNGGVRND